MATDQSFADFVIDQLDGAGAVRSRKMFGEYGVYCDEKMVALICDNQLFVKPTDAGRRFIVKPVEAPPYPGAKPYFLIGSTLDDREWLVELVRVTTRELPAPAVKAPKKKPARQRGGSSTRPRAR